MAPPHTMILFPASLFIFVSQIVAETQPFPVAVRRQFPDSNEKILAEHLAFAPLQAVPVLGLTPFLEDDEVLPSDGTERFSPPYAHHLDKLEENVLRRTAQALDLLKKRAACPAGMNSCGDAGAPNKCCQQGTYCTAVPDTNVGHIACCPSGSTCGGGIGNCPADATSCAAALGGGCCIPGYVCQGVGCVPSTLATSAVSASTTTPQETVTLTRTTLVEGNPTTVVVTVTRTALPEIPSQTSTIMETYTNTGSATGNPPWRQTDSYEPTSPPQSTTASTQTGCPIGFYGCLATHGGGCCRTDRDCHTYSCPPSESTTILSGGVTILVPATNLPISTGTASCANGWFLCGKDAGAAAGCCPSGYECGTASCFTSGATVTGKTQKQAPDQSTAVRISGIVSATWALITLALLL